MGRKSVNQNQSEQSEKKDLRKIIFKNRSGASMVLMKDLEPYDAAQRRSALKRMYTDWRGEFIIIR